MTEHLLTEERVGRITGSRIAGVLGISPYETPETVMREMVRQHFGADREFTGNIFTEWGNEYEPSAIKEYEAQQWTTVHPHKTKVHDTELYLAHSPDGLVEDEGMIEVKCPYRGGYRVISERPDYEAQIRLGMEVFGRRWTDFVVWTAADGITTSTVKHDPDWLPSVKPTLLSFMERYTTIIHDRSLAEPYLTPLADERSDAEWQEAAQEWLEAKWLEDRAKERVSKAKQDLLNLAEKKTVGLGVQVIEKKGRITRDYAGYMKDHEIELPIEYITTGDPTREVRRHNG